MNTDRKNIRVYPCSSVVFFLFSFDHWHVQLFQQFDSVDEFADSAALLLGFDGQTQHVNKDLFVAGMYTDVAATA